MARLFPGVLKSGSFATGAMSPLATAAPRERRRRAAIGARYASGRRGRTSRHGYDSSRLFKVRQWGESGVYFGRTNGYFR